MMFNSLEVLNAFLGYFQCMMGLLGYNPIKR
jgi:hypothetical protein